MADKFKGEIGDALGLIETRGLIGMIEAADAMVKTANVVLGNAFGIPGITVDTHFGRLSRRFGWTVEDDPVKVEHEVGALFPKKEWTVLSHRLIWHGRRVCVARMPRCEDCVINDLCPSSRV